jgi:hypothetical protein
MWTAVAAIASCICAVTSCGVLIKVSFIAGRVVEKVERHDVEIRDLKQVLCR